jgi:hypothetical protein
VSQNRLCVLDWDWHRYIYHINSGDYNCNHHYYLFNERLKIHSGWRKILSNIQSDKFRDILRKQAAGEWTIYATFFNTEELKKLSALSLKNSITQEKEK